MSLITIVDSYFQLGRPKLIPMFIFGLKKMSFLCTKDLGLKRKTGYEEKKLNMVEKCSKHEEYRDRHTLVLR